MARIERIKLAGWMPFSAEHDVELPPGPIAVVARYRTNPRRSNWAGKTSLIEAVTWALFGTHRKRLDDGVISNGSDECYVEIDLGDGLVVRRSRKRGSSTVLTVTVDGESRRGAAAQQQLVERLGVTLDDYEATVSFRQDDIESIVGLRAGKRREIISAWLRLERWTHAAKKAGERSRKALQRLGEIRASVSSLEASLLAIAVVGTEVADLEAELAELRATEASVAAAIESHGDVDELERLLGELAELRKTVATLRPKLQARGELGGAAEDAREKLAAARSKFDAAAQRLGELSKIREKRFDGVCPIICESCPVSDHVQAVVESSVELRTKALASWREAQSASDQAQIRVDRTTAELRRLDTVVGAYNAALARGKTVRSVVGDRTLSDVQETREKLSRLRDDRRELSQQIVELVRQEADQRAQHEQSRRLLETRDRLRAELLAAEREVRISALMLRALGPTGVPARIARSHIEALESSANELLVDSGLSLEFAWERATKERAPTCVACGHIYAGQREKSCPQCEADRGPKMSDELEILVDDGSGEVEDVKAKSGGARVLVASALRLAASAMLREVRGASVAWATIDEPFGPLDSELREALARVFSGMLGSVGLEQAFVVSHDQALLDSLPAKIVVERGDGSSTFRLEAA